MRDKFYRFFSFVGEYALYGLLFSIAISNSLVEIFALLVIISFVGRKIIKPDFKFLRFQPNIFLILFFIFMAFSLYNSGWYFYGSLRTLVGKWMKYMSIYLILQDSIYDQKIIKRGMVIFLFSASLAVLSGLSQYFFGEEFLRNKSMVAMDSGMRAITSSFAHYNSFGGYLVVVLSLVTALLLADSSFGLKAISLSIFSIFSIAAIVLTFSRGSWIALAGSFIIVSIFGRKKIGRLIPIFLVIIVTFFLPEIRERLCFVFKASGDANRFKYWSAAFKMINEHPLFGMGIGTFMANLSKYLSDSRISYAHNCYLQIWAETGIFSLISFLVFTASLIYLGVKKFLESKDFLLLGLLSGTVGFLVHSFFDTNLYSLRLAFLFWIWAGLIVTKLRVAK